MVTDGTPDPTIGDAPDRSCATCGHRETDHHEQELEIPGGTLRRVFCEPCDAFHEFVPHPLDR